MDVKTGLKYRKSHEWMTTEGATRRVGVSDFAQEQLGDIVFVEFPDEGKNVKAGDEVCIIESVKATASIYAPVDGTIVKCNKGLTDAPEKINQSPYEDGWLFEIEPADGADESGLMDAEAYKKHCEEEEG